MMRRRRPIFDGRDLYGRHPAEPGRHRGERRRQRQCNGDPDAVEPGGRQLEHGDLWRGRLNLYCRDRAVDRLGGDRHVNALLAGVTLDAGGELQRQLLDRHQRRRRGGAGRSPAARPSPGSRSMMADGDQFVDGRDLYGRHPAEPGRHRGERRRQRQCDGDPDAVEPGGRQLEHGDLWRRDLDLQCGNRAVDRLGGDRQRQRAAGRGDADAGGFDRVSVAVTLALSTSLTTMSVRFERRVFGVGLRRDSGWSPSAHR